MIYSEVLAVSCGLLLGFGDACFNTQCFSILGVMYPEDSAPAFALFKFEQVEYSHLCNIIAVS